MITWPYSYLPQPSIDYSGASESRVVRTKMDSGRTRQRKRNTSPGWSLSVMWEFTDAEFLTFKTFYEELLNGGADWFLMRIPMGQQLTELPVRFSGNYRFQYKSHMSWTVRATLDCETKIAVDQATVIAILIDGNVEGLILSLDDLHEFVHTTLPNT